MSRKTPRKQRTKPVVLRIASWAARAALAGIRLFPSACREVIRIAKDRAKPRVGKTGITSARPQALSDFIGQAHVRANLKVFIDAARARNEPLDHVLLAG